MMTLRTALLSALGFSLVVVSFLSFARGCPSKSAAADDTATGLPTIQTAEPPTALRNLEFRQQLLIDSPPHLPADSERSGRATDHLPKRPAGALWQSRYQRTSFFLPTHFLYHGDGLHVDSLVRHKILNPQDLPLAEGEIAMLAELLRLLSARLTDLKSGLYEARQLEMIHAIETGRVKETIVIPDQPRLRAQAKALQRHFRPNESVEEIMARLTPSPDGSYINHCGKFYMFRDFDELPVSDRMFRGYRDECARAMGLVMNWFVLHGCSGWTDEHFSALEAIGEFTAARFRAGV